MLDKLLLIVAVLALLVGAAAMPATAWLDAQYGAEVQVLTVRYPADEVEFYRAIRDESDPIAEIYGVPFGELRRVLLFTRDDNVIVPDEAPDQILVYTGKGGAPSPMLTAVAYHRATLATIAAAAAFVLFPVTYLWRRARRKRREREKANHAPTTG